jgi:hypothetical protein
MNYIIIETQTTNGVSAVLTFVETGLYEALAKYHEKCAAAARSAVPLHAVSLITENGSPVKDRHEAFDHTPAPEAEE